MNQEDFETLDEAIGWLLWEGEDAWREAADWDKILDEVEEKCVE